jgi:hypothetical protein
MKHFIPKSRKRIKAPFIYINMLNTTIHIQSILAGFENSETPFTESEIYESLLNCVNILSAENQTNELNYEIVAFGLIEDTDHARKEWEPWRSPAAVVENEKPGMVELVDPAEISLETLYYWSRRVKETKNPLMKSRYADLVWSFSKKLGKVCDPDFAHIAIDSILEMAKRRYYKNGNYLASKFKRALMLALSLEDYERVEKVLESINIFEQSISNISNFYLEVIDLIHSIK